MARKYTIWPNGTYEIGTDTSPEILVPDDGTVGTEDGKGANVELGLHPTQVGDPSISFRVTLERFDDVGGTWRVLMSADFENGWDGENPIMEMGWQGLATLVGQKVHFIWERRSQMRLTATGLAVTLV